MTIYTAFSKLTTILDLQSNEILLTMSDLNFLLFEVFDPTIRIFRVLNPGTMMIKLYLK